MYDFLFSNGTEIKYWLNIKYIILGFSGDIFCRIYILQIVRQTKINMAKNVSG